ncbi:DUF1295 domain-containing protein [Xanthovirga aplysinae]|uniref:DUF1295 domain-containing protein n=1 Tax=Xanthovirga aplysinae TaxID=2529853 RepID=UPI0012BC7DAA|nr:DUF1295 domain-containing protein [Xanthovirga aplysinae]MTI32529.1 DUF1295 domain-containing protein [Xanthovirga aplysinae]
MSFPELLLYGFLVILMPLTFLWLLSLLIENVSTVDVYRGVGFVLISIFYFLNTTGFEERKMLIMALVMVWGLRLSAYMIWINFGKPEHPRHQKIRRQFDPKKFWWISFFRVFFVQGILMTFVSMPLLGAQYYSGTAYFTTWDKIGLLVWTIGFIFEAGSDYQMLKFKANPKNKGKVLQNGFWKYSRHPNYFGGALVWWGYALISIGGGMYFPVISAVFVTFWFLSFTHWNLVEKSRRKGSSAYEEYVRKTSNFFPFPPKRRLRVTEK